MQAHIQNVGIHKRHKENKEGPLLLFSAYGRCGALTKKETRGENSSLKEKKRTKAEARKVLKSVYKKEE